MTNSNAREKIKETTINSMDTVAAPVLVAAAIAVAITALVTVAVYHKN